MSARAAALGALECWSPPTTEQAALRDRFVTHLKAHPDGLRRSCRPGHLTAGTLVLSHDLDAVLLNLHRKAGRWFHFGGHWEWHDPTLLATAGREAAEESGLADLLVYPEPVHLDVHTVDFCDVRGPVDHLDVRYAAVAPADAEARVSGESLAVRWWTLDVLPALEPELRELIVRARERCGVWDRRNRQSPEPSRRAPIE